MSTASLVARRLLWAGVMKHVTCAMLIIGTLATGCWSRRAKTTTAVTIGTSMVVLAAVGLLVADDPSDQVAVAALSIPFFAYAVLINRRPAPERAAGPAPLAPQIVRRAAPEPPPLPGRTTDETTLLYARQAQRAAAQRLCAAVRVNLRRIRERDPAYHGELVAIAAFGACD